MKEVSELLTAIGTFLVGVASLIKVCKQKEQPNNSRKARKYKRN